MPVAFVPFGVAAVNFVGLSRFVAKVLLATGMARDRATKGAGLSLASQAYAKVFVLDNISDMYQFAAGGTVVYSLTSAVVMGQGLADAASALAVLSSGSTQPRGALSACARSWRRSMQDSRVLGNQL
jgi:hypothetical protein